MEDIQIIKIKLYMEQAKQIIKQTDNEDLKLLACEYLSACNAFIKIAKRVEEEQND